MDTNDGGHKFYISSFDDGHGGHGGHKFYIASIDDGHK